MRSHPQELRIYETSQGETPFSSWLSSLRDREARARIRKRLDRIELGNLGDYRSVGGGVFEFKIDYGPGYRVYFAQIDLLIILLLCGGDKSTQERDILQAKQFWLDYKQREHANE
ncbi:type II toxin-antitoxin system RelE/ParE family toxin [Pseudanabaena sp. PCC 6802]|uniref:type II toxin-antitoxin system RelE/ParE family toxin n=1 Tax=Pseudanabaena sp. PCC 6802 TaxID=118173 RepID=UPI0003480511|nr:type II toxin-antitoxin system RelE/ParE family toxin [Pseudanabaena sp. PCC 6802]